MKTDQSGSMAASPVDDDAVAGGTLPRMSTDSIIARLRNAIADLDLLDLITRLEQARSAPAMAGKSDSASHVRAEENIETVIRLVRDRVVREAQVACPHRSVGEARFAADDAFGATKSIRVCLQCGLLETGIPLRGQLSGRPAVPLSPEDALRRRRSIEH